MEHGCPLEYNNLEEMMMMQFVIQERWCIRDVWEVFDCGLYVLI